MKLIPTVISAKCPACKGTRGTKIYPIGADLSDPQAIYWWVPCSVCMGVGSFYSVAFAPVGYDGVSKIEISAERTLKNHCRKHKREKNNV